MLLSSLLLLAWPPKKYSCGFLLLKYYVVKKVHHNFRCHFFFQAKEPLWKIFLSQGKKWSDLVVRVINKRTTIPFFYFFSVYICNFQTPSRYCVQVLQKCYFHKSNRIFTSWMVDNGQSV